MFDTDNVLLRIWPSPEQCIDKRGHRLSSETAFEATQEECKEWKAFILSSTQPTIDMETLHWLIPKCHA